MEPKFASAYVRFAKDPLDDLADVHVVIALVEERKCLCSAFQSVLLAYLQANVDALVVKPRIFGLVDAISQTYRTWIGAGWTFSCDEVRCFIPMHPVKAAHFRYFLRRVRRRIANTKKTESG